LLIIFTQQYSTVLLSGFNHARKYKKKLDSLYIRLLRTACRDYKKQIPKIELQRRCKRASPQEWANYLASSRVIKTIRDHEPKELYIKISSNYYEESRRQNIGYFFDGSKSATGKQSLENRLEFFKDYTKPWNIGLNNDEIRIYLKKQIFDYCKWFLAIIKLLV